MEDCGMKARSSKAVNLVDIIPFHEKDLHPHANKYSFFYINNFCICTMFVCSEAPFIRNQSLIWLILIRSGFEGDLFVIRPDLCNDLSPKTIRSEFRSWCPKMCYQDNKTGRGVDRPPYDFGPRRRRKPPPPQTPL